MVKIPLGKEKFAIVSEEDGIYLLLLTNSWRLRSDGYIDARIAGKMQLLHQIIAVRMGLISPIIDHKDRDKLNNRRENLRIANAFQSMGNRSVNSNNKLALKGVKQLPGGSFIARIRVNRKDLYLGTFATAELAAKAYDAAAKIHYKDFAGINYDL